MADRGGIGEMAGIVGGDEGTSGARVKNSIWIGSENRGGRD
jgi:hypothetical protein